MMAGIRGGDTGPELAVRRALFARGLRYRLHVKGLPGKPDIVLAGARAALFVHGCFWHGHDCPLFRLPRTRRDFWEAKIAANRTRDGAVRTALAAAGWRQLVIWECALRGARAPGAGMVADRTRDWLRGAEGFAEIRGPV
jgi:DNA mismatch endonuclease (patch repair protein)